MPIDTHPMSDSTDNQSVKEVRHQQPYVSEKVGMHVYERLRADKAELTGFIGL